MRLEPVPVQASSPPPAQAAATSAAAAGPTPLQPNLFGSLGNIYPQVVEAVVLDGGVISL